MTAHASATAETLRLTPPRIILMLTGAAVLFAAAYLVGGVFGRAADDQPDGAARADVPAVEPSGTPLLSVLAQAVAFDTAAIRVPAGTAARLRVANEDAGIYHNIAVYRDRRASDLIQRGALFDGPRARDYVFEPFLAGTYYFQCDLHPAMNGTLIAE